MIFSITILFASYNNFTSTFLYNITLYQNSSIKTLRFFFERGAKPDTSASTFRKNIYKSRKKITPCFFFRIKRYLLQRTTFILRIFIVNEIQGRGVDRMGRY